MHVADASAPASESRFAALYKTEPRITVEPDAARQRLHHAPTSRSCRVAPASPTRSTRCALLADAPTARARARLRRAHRHLQLPLRRLAARPRELSSCRRCAHGERRRRRAGAHRRLPRRLRLARGPAPVDRRSWRPVRAAARPRQQSFPARPPLVQRPAQRRLHPRAVAARRRAPPPCCAAAISPTRRAANPQTLAVNLSSDRVRLALSLLEGIRNGQSLGALLGYRFERGLHDDHGLAEVDKFIYPLRKAFPLVGRRARADQDAARRPDRGDRGAQRPRRPQAASRRSARAAQATYPFGLSTACPTANDAEAAGDQRRRRTRCSTSTTRSPISRWPRACTRPCRATSTASRATLDAYTTGNFPPEPRGRADAARRHRPDPSRRGPPPARPRGAAGRDAARAGRAGDRRLARRACCRRSTKIGCTVAWTDPRRRRARSSAGHARRPRAAPDRRARAGQAGRRAGDDRARRPHPALRASRPPRRGPTPPCRSAT